jgi:hypothetical protein
MKSGFVLFFLPNVFEKYQLRGEKNRFKNNVQSFINVQMIVLKTFCRIFGDIFLENRF